MSDDEASAADLTALRVAVLRLHEQFLMPSNLRSPQVADRLHRLHLSWLALPWVLIDLGRMLWHLRPGRMMAAEEHAVGLYRQLSGKDPHVARAEIWRIGSQIMTLDERDRGPASDRPGAPRGADPAELEAATAALIGYYLAGRRSADALLEDIQTAWAEYEELEEQHQQHHQRGLDRRGRRRERRRQRRDEASADQRAAEVLADRYLVAWRRWLDRPPTRP